MDDAHQPLCASARITGFEPEGDHRGNDFGRGKTHPIGRRDCSANLHALWDHILENLRSWHAPAIGCLYLISLLFRCRRSSVVSIYDWK